MGSYDTTHNEPVEFKFMDVEEPLELAPLYDQYEFPIGIQMCDEVLSTAFKENKDENLAYHVLAVVMANDFNLKKTFYWGRISLLEIRWSILL